jgi:hypothetical protein
MCDVAGESAGKAMGRIYSNIGFGGLWNGLPVRIAMIGTLTAFQWLMYVVFHLVSLHLLIAAAATTPSRSISACLLQVATKAGKPQNLGARCQC